MKKYAPIAMAVILAAAGCGNEVYERNLQYMNEPIYQAEKASVAKQLEQAQAALAKAENSGNPEEIKKARAAYDQVKAKSKDIETEEHRRHRGL